MTNLLFADVYRIMHKKSFYFYFGAVGILYILIAIFRSLNTTLPNTIISDDAMILFPFMQAIIGGYIFYSIYIDDVVSKNLATLIGFGENRVKIVLTKFILSVLLNGIIFALLPVGMYVIFSVLGAQPTNDSLKTAFIFALNSIMSIIGYSAIAGVAVYGLSQPTFSMGLYLLLTFKIIENLIAVILEWKVIKDIVPTLSEYTLSEINNRVLSGLVNKDPNVYDYIAYFVLIGIALTAEVAAFYNKEQEF